MPSNKWPNNARAAISLTLDNMGEAADLNRGLWPTDKPVGSHYSVTKVLPQMLQLLKKYDIAVTYFIESWNINMYGDTILNDIAGAGHEVAWHAWQHEAWAKLSVKEESSNFERSFGKDGIGKWLEKGLIEPYRGFRPPGGIINGEFTLKKCREYGLNYLSPAAEKAAIVDVKGTRGSLVILPFRWRMVDAYFYMDSFEGLRKIKGEANTEPQKPDVLVKRYIAEIDETIRKGGFLAILFHPFLTDSAPRLEAFETVLKHLVEKRKGGEIWLARSRDVDEYIRANRDVVGSDPGWDTSSWR